jgi:hypothetical protein
MSWRSPGARPIPVATIVGAAVAVWSGAARASGNELGALGALIVLALVIFAGVPWAISLFLLLRKSSPGTCIVGTLTSGIAFVVVLVAALPPQPLVYVGIALLPAAAHLLKRWRGRQDEKSGAHR